MALKGLKFPIMKILLIGIQEGMKDPPLVPHESENFHVRMFDDEFPEIVLRSLYQHFGR